MHVYTTRLQLLLVKHKKYKNIQPLKVIKCVFTDAKSSKLFSPRMDYDQWTPLGRGDPLKNDPTYDYVPPVLDRVHYWVDPSSRKPDTEKKTEILVLGVSSKKPSIQYTKADSRRDQYDPYLQYIEGTNYNFQRRPYEVPYYFKNEKEPFTILVPPPVNNKDSLAYQTQMSSIQTTTLPSTSISIDEANLVYHSSSVSNDWKGSNTYATIAEPSSQVTWRTPANKTTFVMQPVNMKNMEADIIVVPPEIGMHKGQVSDDTLDLSSTFVNIGKPDAQVQSSGLGIDLSTEPLTPPDKNAPMTFGTSLYMVPTSKLENTPMTLQMTMHTLPPTTERTKKNNFLQALLKKETTVFLPTTLPPTTTTTLSSLTTDPLFKHYKQPAEPLKGPLYLIIQGHSKVKTYGPSKQFNGISIQETNEISTSDDRGMDYPVKHLHDVEKGKEDWKRESRSSKLQTLNHVVKTNLGALEFADRSEVKQAEVGVKYDVSDKETSSEVYHKGIVESEKAPSRQTLYSLKFEKNK